MNNMKYQPCAYAFKNTPDEVMKSSSGGAFIAICNVIEIVCGKGNVLFCGSAFDDTMNVCHSIVYTAEECHKFQGSKYVRSNLRDCFSLILDNLIIGKHVLFSGTPCQIAALNKLVKNKGIDDERLFTIDVICHGTPKKKFWDDYKRWIETKANGKLVNYSFRYKPEGWKAYPGYAEFDNGVRWINKAEMTVFTKLHMKGYITEKKCFSCPYAKEGRNSDITLGDFWGIEKITDKIPYKTGVSLILSNTAKAERLIKKIPDILKGSDIYLVKLKDKHYLSEQHNLHKPTDCPENYNEFWDDYRVLSFNDVVKKYTGFGKLYIIKHNIKRLIRKSVLIDLYRKLK